MPYTKRIPVHAGERGTGLYNCLEYVRNGDKTEDGILVNSLNCTVEFAEQEFLYIQRKYHKENDDRVAYHVIQSFDIRDDITPEQANEIGMKLCKEIYPNYQCVVSTHIDKGHLHNHIVLNATSLSGRKLEDRLANKIEGLYGLREASDRISLEYGCHVMKDFKPIGKYRRKDYSWKLQETTIKKIYENATAIWKPRIIEQIEKLKKETNSFDELMERLALEGYQIKRGKYLSIKPYGKERFTRLHKLGDEYSEEALRQFFKDKKKGSYVKQLKAVNGYKGRSKYSDSYVEQANNSKLAMELSSKGQQVGKEYPKYYNSRYKEFLRYKELAKSLDFMSAEKIFSYEDLAEKIEAVELELAEREAEYEKQKSIVRTFEENEPFAHTYIETYNAYMLYKEQVEKFGEENITISEDVQKHLTAKENLNDAELQEVREFIRGCGQEKREANRQYSYITYLHSKLTDYDKLRSRALEMNGYIKGMNFGIKMIDEKRSTDEYYCVKLPYTKKYVYLNKNCVTWKEHGVRATMYLIDDETYELYNEDNQKIGEVSGDQLEQISNEEKEEVKEYYASLKVEV